MYPERFSRICLGNIEAGQVKGSFPGRAFLKDEPLILIDVGRRLCDFAHFSRILSDRVEAPFGEQRQSFQSLPDSRFP
jgi:hypothetical protein